MFFAWFFKRFGCPKWFWVKLNHSYLKYALVKFVTFLWGQIWPLAQWMAGRWQRLKLTQASWAMVLMVLGLSASVPPGGKMSRFWMRGSISLVTLLPAKYYTSSIPSSWSFENIVNFNQSLKKMYNIRSTYVLVGMKNLHYTYLKLCPTVYCKQNISRIYGSFCKLIKRL